MEKNRKSIAEGFESVTTINKSDYDDFDYLQSIVFHSKIVSIEIQTFRYCRNLTRIDVDSANMFFSSEDGVLFNKDKTILICYPANRIGSVYTVPKTVKRIENFAFSGSRLYRIQFNEGLLEIGDCGFEGCNNLDELKLPESIESIGYVAFQGCGRLRQFYIPKSLNFITFPALPEELDSIDVAPENHRFCIYDGVLFDKEISTLIRMPGHYAIDRYDVPKSVRTIEGSAFSCCNNVSTFFIPETVCSIGAFAFASLDESQTVIIPKRFSVDIDRISSTFSLSKAIFKTY